MALPSRVDSKDEIPKGLEEHYVEDGDALKAYTEIIAGTEQVSGLKSALRKEKDQRLKATRRADELAGEVETMKAELADLNAKPPAPNGDGDGGHTQEAIDKIVAKRRKEWEDEVTPKLKEGDDAKAELRTLKLTNVARAAALKAGVLKDAVDDFLKIIGHRFTLNDEGKVAVLDEDGDESGKTLDDLFGKELKKTKAMFYEGSGASGSGASPSQRTPGGAGDWHNLPPTERAKLGLQRATT